MTTKRMNAVQEFVYYDGTNETEVLSFLGGTDQGAGMDLVSSGTDPLHIDVNSGEVNITSVDVAADSWVTPWFSYSDTDLAQKYSPANPDE